jgi:hypothetical protein
MLNKSIIKTSLVIVTFLFLFNLSSYTQDCSKITDVDTVNVIYDQIATKYESQMSHINVRIKDGIVTLEGWVTEKKVKKEIEKFAKKTACVKKVDNQLTIGIGGGCSQGQKVCGDICIPSTETCNIKVKNN